MAMRTLSPFCIVANSIEHVAKGLTGMCRLIQFILTKQLLMTVRVFNIIAESHGIVRPSIVVRISIVFIEFWFNVLQTVRHRLTSYQFSA